MLAWSLKNSCATKPRKTKNSKVVNKKPVSHRKKPPVKESFTAIDTYLTPLNCNRNSDRHSRDNRNNVQQLKGIMSSEVASANSSAAPESSVNNEGKERYRLRNHSYQQSQLPGKTPLITFTPLKEPVHEGGESGSDVAEEEVTFGNKQHTVEADEMGSIEDLLPPKFLLKKEEFEKKNTNNKLDSVFEAVNNLYSMYAQVEAKMKPLNYAVFDGEGGILPQIQEIVAHTKEKDKKLDLLTAEVIQLREELDITKGLVHKQSKQISALRGKQTDLIARSMAENITIMGIEQDKPNVDVKTLVLNFLSEELGVELEEDEVIPVAHCLGAPVKGQHRPIVFKCPPSLRKRIFENTRKLAGKNYSINQQLPDVLAEQRRENRQRIKQIQKLEESKSENEKSTFLIHNHKLYVNGQAQRKKLVPPLPCALFPGKTERDKMASIQMKYSQSKSAQTSSFSAAACTVESMNQVHLAYKRLFREFPEADHIVAAATCSGEEMHQDDSEFGAGYRILNMIRDYHLGNVAVFVIRHYGGEHVGPMRFAVMQEVAEEALTKLG